MSAAETTALLGLPGNGRDQRQAAIEDVAQIDFSICCARKAIPQRSGDGIWGLAEE
jgi:putative lipase involved disintegration of autophagic bodies